MLFFPFWFNNLCKFCSKNLNRFDLFPSDEEWFDRVKILVGVSFDCFLCLLFLVLYTNKTQLHDVILRSWEDSSNVTYFLYEQLGWWVIRFIIKSNTSRITHPPTRHSCVHFMIFFCLSEGLWFPSGESPRRFNLYNKDIFYARCYEH